ncbi:tyrosine-type recombinase/integrase [bacterium]|nr:tyrosine-type recombinase/integrase [bacterium]
MQYIEAVELFCAHMFSARGRARLSVEAYRRDLLQFAELAWNPAGTVVPDSQDPVGASLDSPPSIAEAGRSGPATTKQAGQDPPLQALDRESVLRWTLALAERGMSARSRARKLSALRAFVAWAMEYRYLDSDPVPRELSSPRAMYLPHALSEEDVLAILAAAGGQPAGAEGDEGASDAHAPAGLPAAAGLRDRAMLEVLYASGMRVSELTGLRLQDLHLGEGFALVSGKGSKQRLVPLGGPAIEALQRWLDAGRAVLCPRSAIHDEVFLSRRGPISRSQVFRLIKAYAAAAGVKGKVSPHTFRHSCASHMLAHGADLRLVQELLGHSALSTTQVYTHIERSRLRAVYDKTHPLA